MEAVTREQFVKMILLALDLYEETSPQAAFGDVEAGAWYAPYIASAVSQGIIKGISETEFGVGQQVSRQDMAVILYRAMAKTGWVFADAGSQTAFSDDGDIAAYAKEAVASLSAAGIINGMTESTFAPGQAANPRQAAVILYRMLEAMEQTNSGEGEA